jgi:hypothetical protein
MRQMPRLPLLGEVFQPIASLNELVNHKVTYLLERLGATISERSSRWLTLIPKALVSSVVIVIVRDCCFV